MNKNNITIIVCETESDFNFAKELILEYVNWLGMDLSFQNFEKEMESLPSMYSKEDGGIFLAKVDGKAAGVVGLRRFSNEDAEIKRMFVKPEYRGMKIGQLMMDKCISSAKERKYSTIKLDTADYMTQAIKLYTVNGFKNIPAYRHNPHKEALYFELLLNT